MFRRAPINRFFGSLFGGGSAANKEAPPSASEQQQQEATSSTTTTTTAPRAKYATGMDAISDDSSWGFEPTQEQQQQPAHQSAIKRSDAERKQGRPLASSPGSSSNSSIKEESSGGAASSSSSSSSEVAKQQSSDGGGAVTGWMAGAEWASIGEEFKGVDPSKFLKPSPEGFLTHRAVTDVQPAEELLQDFLAVIHETYKDIDVRDPNTVTKVDGERPKWLTMGGKVRAVAEFMSGHLAHQVSLPVWMDIFDLKYMEGDLMFWLWVIHLHIVARRATSVKIDVWSRRREVLEELVLTMFQSWNHTSEEIMGRPPLARIRQYIKDMYYVTAINLEEALVHDGPGGDLALLGILIKFCPLPRPEDIPLYTYYTLVHYIRFHIALFDRISDEEFSRGNFNFFAPDDPAVFRQYGDIEMDEVIRGWKVGGDPADGASSAEDDAAAAAASSSSESAGASAAAAEPKVEKKQDS